MSNIMQATHHQDGDDKDALHACEKHKKVGITFHFKYISL
jgi:hypothetical protein